MAKKKGLEMDSIGVRNSKVNEAFSWATCISIAIAGIAYFGELCTRHWISKKDFEECLKNSTKTDDGYEVNIE